MDEVSASHHAAVADLVSRPGRVMVIGGIDTGKTAFSLALARESVRAGIPTALIDADLALPVVGPPGTIGLKMLNSAEDLGALDRSDALAFVGSVTPRGKLLPMVVGVAKLVFRAIELGARMTIIDTSGLIGGVSGQVLKLHKAELCRPRTVVSLARGGEMEPINEDLRRLLSQEIIELGVHPSISTRSVDERMNAQEAKLRNALGPKQFRWKVKPTVFMPTLTPMAELSHLDGLLVGVDDGHGDCLGLGVLEYREETLRLLTPVSEGIRALRLGSVKVTPRGTIAERVDLGFLLGSD